MPTETGRRSTQWPRATWMMILLLAAVVTSGCSSNKQAAGAEQEKNREIATATFDDQTGGVEGQVVDVGQGIPVEGAAVGIVSLKLGVFTNANGAYALSSVAPGTYEIVVQKVGYYDRTVAVIVVAGEVGTKNVELVPVPVPASHDAYFAPNQPAAGNWGCAYGVGVVPANDPCASLSPIRNTVRVARNGMENVTGYVFSVQWQSSSAIPVGKVEVRLPIYQKPPATAESALAMLKACVKCEVVPTGVTPGAWITVQGENGMVVWVNSVNISDPYEAAVGPGQNFSDFKVSPARGEAADPNTWGKLAVQQNFQVGVGWFYWAFKPKDVEDLAPYAWGLE